MSQCKFCNKKINNIGSLTAHEMCCSNNPNKIHHKRSTKAGQKKGCLPWNKNKTFNKKNIANLTLTIETGKYKTYSERRIVTGKQIGRAHV